MYAFTDNFQALKVWDIGGLKSGQCFSSVLNTCAWCSCLSALFLIFMMMVLFFGFVLDNCSGAFIFQLHS